METNGERGSGKSMLSARHDDDDDDDGKMWKILFLVEIFTKLSRSAKMKIEYSETFLVSGYGIECESWLVKNCFYLFKQCPIQCCLSDTFYSLLLFKEFRWVLSLNPGVYSQNLVWQVLLIPFMYSSHSRSRAKSSQILSKNNWNIDQTARDCFSTAYYIELFQWKAGLCNNWFIDVVLTPHPSIH